MKIIIPSIQTPFIIGGAYFHILNLKNALIKHGHETEVVTFPFKFSPNSYISTMMEQCIHQDFSSFNGHNIDKIIALQFPTYYIPHPNKTLWIMHQFRDVYDLYVPTDNNSNIEKLKKVITDYDNNYLNTTKTIFTNSKTVANRLKKFNNIDSTPLYHPPSHEDKFYCDKSYDYIFFPSRLEKLKRQDILIKAMQYTKTNIKAILAGSGAEKRNYQQLIDRLELNQKVQLIGEISEKQKFDFSANALAVAFIPKDEDYGYITLEAMLSSKPVLTCHDSGGVLEFIEDNYSGFITEPSPEDIAQKLDWFYENKSQTIEMGKNAKEAYLSKNISWNNVVQKLLQN